MGIRSVGRKLSNVKRRCRSEGILTIPILIIVILLFAAWKYSGNHELEFTQMDGNEMTLSNGSRWLVFGDDCGRVATWERGDMVKLIEEPNVFPYNWLMLNIDKQDVAWVRCVEDAL